MNNDTELALNLHEYQSNFFLECTAPLLTDEEPIQDEADERSIIGSIAFLNDEIAAAAEEVITTLRNRRAQLLVHLALYRIAKFKTQGAYRRL
jgi:hypothetical protein